MMVTKAQIVLSAFVATANVHAQEVDAQSALADIRAEIAELRAHGIDGSSWLSQERANEIRAIVSDVLADSATRESLQETNATAGWKDGFFISSTDGNFTMNLRGYTQVRWAYDVRSSVTGLSASNEDDTWGFGIRRTKFLFEGTVIDPSWRYKVEISAGSGSNVLEDAWVEKVITEGVNLKAGQFKTPFMREFLLPDTSTTMVDRSSIEGFFTPGRAQGVLLNWLAGDFQVTVAYLNAFEVKSNYYSSGNVRDIPWPSTKNSQYAFAGRLEWKPVGAWKDLRDLTGWRGEEFSAMFGIGGEIEKKDNNQGVPAMYGDLNPSVCAVTADATFEWSGASVFTYGIWRVVDPNDAAFATADQFGFVIQGGVFVSDTVELTARYEYGDADSNPNDIAPVVGTTINANGYSIFSAATVGMNWYIAKQRVKIAADLGYAFDGVGAFANAGNGFLADGTTSTGAFDENGQILARVQLQIVW